MWKRLKGLWNRAEAASASGLDAEGALWLKLRDLRFLGFRFRRRTEVLTYAVDFVEPAARLVIMLESGARPASGAAGADPLKDKILRREGYRVLHFYKDEIISDINAVREAVVMELLLRQRDDAAEPLPG